MLIIEGADHLGKTVAAKELVSMAADVAERSMIKIRAAEAKSETAEWEDGVDGLCFTYKDFPYPIRYAHMSRPNASFNFFEDYRDILSMYAVQDRFHLGSLVWHEDVMDEAKLRLIESWLAALGSIVVVFYTTNEEWYIRHLENGKDELFTVEQLLVANRKYTDMATGTFTPQPRVDFPILVDPENGFPFPTPAQLMAILDKWLMLLFPLPRIG